ncbi:MAG: transposase [Phycisphaerales bacterium]|nr:transposase [Phycisphaerales bacterium]
MPILDNATAHKAIVDVWKDAKAWLVGRYVVMPDHVHLFATPAPLETIDPAMAVELCSWVSFWKRRLALVLGRGIWQEGYWDRTLRSDDSYDQKWAYVRDNPVRKGLVKAAGDWPYAGTLNELIW